MLDYKTGGFWRDDWKGTFNGGRRLQHALYGLAAVELLRARYKNPKVTGATTTSPVTRAAASGCTSPRRRSRRPRRCSATCAR